MNSEPSFKTLFTLKLQKDVLWVETIDDHITIISRWYGLPLVDEIKASKEGTPDGSKPDVLNSIVTNSVLEVRARIQACRFITKYASILINNLISYSIWYKHIILMQITWALCGIVSSFCVSIYLLNNATSLRNFGIRVI